MSSTSSDLNWEGLENGEVLYDPEASGTQGIDVFNMRGLSLVDFLFRPHSSRRVILRWSYLTVRLANAERFGSLRVYHIIPLEQEIISAQVSRLLRYLQQARPDFAELD